MTLQKRIDERELSRQDVSEEFRGGGLERAKKPVLSALPPGLESLASPCYQGRVETAQGQILPQRRWLTTNPYYSPKGHYVLKNWLIETVFIKYARGDIFP